MCSEGSRPSPKKCSPSGACCNFILGSTHFRTSSCSAFWNLLDSVCSFYLFLRGTSHGASSRTSTEDGLGPQYCNLVVLQPARMCVPLELACRQHVTMLRIDEIVLTPDEEHVLVSDGFGCLKVKLNQTQKSATPAT